MSAKRNDGKKFTPKRIVLSTPTGSSHIIGAPAEQRQNRRRLLASPRPLAPIASGALKPPGSAVFSRVVLKKSPPSDSVRLNKK
jgi:hypothetical protein